MHAIMINQFLLSLEDPNKPLLGPNYWILKKIGFILPESKIGKFAYIFLHETVTIFVITQYIELYVIRSNLNHVLTNLKISMLSIVCIVKSNTFVIWQQNWKELIDYVTEADKEEREDKDSTRAAILDNYTRYCRKITYFYWSLVFTTFVTVVTTPLMIYLSENYLEKDVPSENRELFYHVFSSWMPFDKYHSPGSWITVIWHTFMCAYGATSMAAFDVTSVVIMVFVGGKLDMFRERCKNILGSVGNGVSDEEAAQTFRRMHRTHVQLLKYSNLFNSLQSPVMFLYVVMCSLCLCASAFQLTSATNTTQKLLMAEYLVFGIAQLFLFCWHSNGVLHKSDQVMRGTYESAWWSTSSIKQRRNLMLLTEQLRKIICFSAGPFTNLTLATFINILKGAYSYYTLLRK